MLKAIGALKLIYAIKNTPILTQFSKFILLKYI